MKKRKKAFTLVELLATVIILAIVLLIAIPQVLNIITKTKKNAFAADSIVAGKDAVSLLKVQYLKGNVKELEEGESITIDIDSLNNSDLSEYTGNVTIIRENNKLIPYVTITDNKYYICNTQMELISASIVTTDSKCINSDITEVNDPEIIDGLTPIITDENGNEVETDANDISWYSYSADEKRWANAKTADGSMWVWIPRYAYRINEGYHSSEAGVIEVKFLNGNSNIAFDGSTAEAVDQGNNPGSDKKFVVHPAFRFGDIELTGIWVMKFETSSNGGNIASLPNVTSWHDVTVGDMFQYSRSMETNPIYGWGNTGDGIDTHMLKDVEWGAAVYLSWSKYGKNSEIWINNSSTFITGCAGDSVSATPFPGCKYEYNVLHGENASTTGNMTGIYDMSGGAFEYTATYFLSDDSNLSNYGSQLLSADSKYTDVYLTDDGSSTSPYELNSKYYGNAIYETSSTGLDNTSWNGDISLFSGPFNSRGGLFPYGERTGSFAFSPYSGYAPSGWSWRSALIINPSL